MFQINNANHYSEEGTQETWKRKEHFPQPQNFLGYRI